jgi:hypothetical protein
MRGQSGVEVLAGEAPVLNQGMELRAFDDHIYADSTVKYTAAGIPIEKKVYGGGYVLRGMYDLYSWEDNTWVLNAEGLLAGTGQWPVGTFFDGLFQIPVNGNYGRVYDYTGSILKPEYDANNNLVSLAVIDPSSGETSFRWSITYNENNKPAQMERYFGDLSLTKFNYWYDANGNQLLYEETLGNSDDLLCKMTCEYDADSRPTILSYYDWNWTLKTLEPNWYMVYFYSEGTDANEAVDTSPSSAWSYSGLIHIRSERPQQVAIYSLSGAKLYESPVPAGTTTIDATRFSKGVYIVAFGDNERQKIVVH